MTTNHSSFSPGSLTLTDIRVAGGPPRSVAISELSETALIATITDPPEPGTTIQLRLGVRDWVDATVTSRADSEFAAVFRNKLDARTALGTMSHDSPPVRGTASLPPELPAGH